MKKSIFFLLLFHTFITVAQTKDSYSNTYDFIHKMLLNENLMSFKNAVIATENIYNNDTSILDVGKEIDMLVQFIKLNSNSGIEDYDKKDIDIVNKHFSLFKVMTDTITMIVDTSEMIIHLPYKYNFDDPFGQHDWSNMFVTKLLDTGKGNCHSLPYLYKILADELRVPAYLAIAPNHIYIKSYSEKTGWYNTELTSGTFPIDAWIIASGYVTVEAIQNGLYMDTLSTKQSIANCLVDLAHGYQHKFGKNNPEFVVKCCNTCLKYHPTNVNAMLTKAEAQKYYIQTQMKARNVKTPQELFAENTIKEMYTDMEQTYVKLHQSGYRRMPEEMYMQWMGMLKNNSNNFTRKNIKNPK